MKTSHHFVWVLGMACALLAGSAQADLTSGDQPPTALKDIKPVSRTCKKDDPATGPGSISAPDIAADMSCAVSMSELQALARAGGVLADVRPAVDYQLFHIDGALNLTFDQLHSKPYWRNKTVVLVGNGKAERELYGECTRLKQHGYKQVKVLRGGMPLWLAQRQPVVGQAPLASQLQRLAAAEFWLESKNTDNLLLLDKSQAAMQSELTFSFVLSQNSGEAIKSVIERRRKETKNAPLAAVVLALAPGIGEDQISQLQQAIAPVPLLTYIDTPEGFKKQLTVQKAIWVAQARGPKQLGCGL